MFTFAKFTLLLHELLQILITMKLTFAKHTLSFACLVRKCIVLHNRQKHGVAPHQKRIVLLIEQKRVVLLQWQYKVLLQQNRISAIATICVHRHRFGHSGRDRVRVTVEETEVLFVEAP